MMKSILTTIAFLALAVSGLAQTRSVIVNTSGVVQSPTNFWSADVTNARSGLGLGTAATNPASAFQPSSLALSNLASSNGGALTNLTASNITGIVSISNGGSSATTVGGARTNLGLGATWLTNTNSSNFLSAVGLSAIQALNIGSLLVGTHNPPSITNLPRTTYSAESIVIGTNSGNFTVDLNASSSKRFYINSDPSGEGYVYFSGIEGIGF